MSPGTARMLFWPEPPLYAGHSPGPDQGNRRGCGCHADPWVFGHAFIHPEWVVGYAERLLTGSGDQEQQR